jgi:Type IV secretory system Conjugative DNA transfer
LIDDIVSIANALVPDDGDARSKHWNDSARMLLVGLILLTLALPESERHLVTVRELLCLTYKPLAVAAKTAAARYFAKAPPEEKKNYFDANAYAIKVLLNLLTAMGDRFGGIPAAIGSRFSQTPVTERGNISRPLRRRPTFSTACRCVRPCGARISVFRRCAATGRPRSFCACRLAAWSGIRAGCV